MDRGSIRLATYNVEWFNALFDDDGRLLLDDKLSARYHISRDEQLRSLGQVFTALDADGVMVIEAPDTSARRSTVTALERFAAHFGLRCNRAIVGFSSETEQEIAFLYDPTVLHPRHDPIGGASGKRGSRDAPRFDGTFRYDLDTDTAPEVIRFSKPPLELSVGLPNGDELRLIGVHAKSKAPHGAEGREAVMRLSIENRRKQLAQCIWIRARVEDHLAAGDSLVVMGDFNDGPGLDEFEKLFGKSGVEIVLGCDGPIVGRMFDPHAELALQSRIGLSPTTSRFYIASKKRYFEALLDFMMISPDLARRQPNWQIWHPLNDPGVAKVPGLSAALLQASDHFPVTLDLPLARAAPQL
ncbi:MAG: endonuclease/exonuclease/phosphatase family protein [Paracoccaceae bacterium]